MFVRSFEISLAMGRWLLCSASSWLFRSVISDLSVGTPQLQPVQASHLYFGFGSTTVWVLALVFSELVLFWPLLLVCVTAPL